jgi:hypothetical protein
MPLYIKATGSPDTGFYLRAYKIQSVLPVGWFMILDLRIFAVSEQFKQFLKTDFMTILPIVTTVREVVYYLVSPRCLQKPFQVATCIFRNLFMTTQGAF